MVLLRGEISQKTPVLGFGRPVLSQPFPFHLCHLVVTQSESPRGPRRLKHKREWSDEQCKDNFNSRPRTTGSKFIEFIGHNLLTHETSEWPDPVRI